MPHPARPSAALTALASTLLCAPALFAAPPSPAPASAAQAPAPSTHLEQVLRQMDAASLKFRSAEADFKKDLFQRVVRETTTETGSIYFLKSGASTEMGAVINPPDARVIEFKDGRLRLFDPGANHLTTVDARSNQAQFEGFLTLGFGGSGKDLQKNWTITDEGTETLNDGSANVSVEKLDLVAKDPAQRSTFTHVTIWVDPTRAISLKQQFFTPSDDVQTATYTHIRYNQPINTKRFALKTNSKTTS